MIICWIASGVIEGGGLEASSCEGMTGREAASEEAVAVVV